MDEFNKWIATYYPHELNNRFYTSTYDLENGKGKEFYEIYEMFTKTAK